MKAFINWHLFTQTSLDSGSLTSLGAVIHNFPKPGEYLGTILQKEEDVGSFHLTVDEECPAMQVDIDLATLHQSAPECCESELGKRFVVNPKGYAVFYVSRGPGGYAVRVGRLSGESEAELFDSRELKEGDLFAATLIRPGSYSVTNVNTKAKGEIVVGYPKIGKLSYHPPRPLSIESTKNELRLDKTRTDQVRIGAAQGLVFHFRTLSRIKIELVRPDDGPERISRPKIAGWRKPSTR